MHYQSAYAHLTDRNQRGCRTQWWVKPQLRATTTVPKWTLGLLTHAKPYPTSPTTRTTNTLHASQDGQRNCHRTCQALTWPTRWQAESLTRVPPSRTRNAAQSLDMYCSVAHNSHVRCAPHTSSERSTSPPPLCQGTRARASSAR